MKYFQNLNAIVKTLGVDLSTKIDPIKRMFVVDGNHMTANVAIVNESDNALHMQEDHDELLVIIAGGADFRVGDEIQNVCAGDLVFIARDTFRGPTLNDGQKSHRFQSLRRNLIGPKPISSGVVKSSEWLIPLQSVVSPTRLLD